MKTGNPEPRLITQKQAAAYCGVSAPTFAKWVLVGSMPPALSVMKRWDKKAIDAHLDKISGLEVSDTQEDPFEKWKRERDARQARELGLNPKEIQQLRDTERAASRRGER